MQARGLGEESINFSFVTRYQGVQSPPGKESHELREQANSLGRLAHRAVEPALGTERIGIGTEDVLVVIRSVDADKNDLTCLHGDGGEHGARATADRLGQRDEVVLQSSSERRSHGTFDPEDFSLQLRFHFSVNALQGIWQGETHADGVEVLQAVESAEKERQQLSCGIARP